LQESNAIHDVEELRQRIEEEWDGLDERVIDTAIGEPALQLTQDISHTC